MKAYESRFIQTSDGKERLPGHQETYKVGRSYDYQSCLMFMDTQREKDIKLGTRYTAPPMDEGQCVISQQMANNLKITQGQIIYNQLDLSQNLLALV